MYLKLVVSSICHFHKWLLAMWKTLLKWEKNVRIFVSRPIDNKDCLSK